MAAPTVQVLKLRPPAPLASPPARLTEALLAARPGSVTLLAAAPGYGRTTVASAVAAAAAAADEAVAWVSVDAVDAAPGRLLAHIEAAVAGALSSAPYAGSDGSAVAGDLARWDALLDRWSTAPPSWLMLDDLHRVTDPAALGALSYVVGRLPTTVRLLVTSRRDLPALTADLRTSSLLTVLDEGALSLTDGEVREQLSAIDRSLGSSDTQRLVRLCAGWPAAIAAVAAVVERGGPIPELLPWLLGTETEQLLADWWSRLPPPGQDFLLGTAVLPRLHPEVCDLFLGCSDSHATLFELVADHAFLRPADVGDVRGWARHPLLTELLQHRSGQPRLDADRLRAVAAWAAQHDAVDTEVRTLALAGELD
ncbi:MAG: hypothetical protein ACXWDL_09720, partial [Nocardioides sp.]